MKNERKRVVKKLDQLCRKILLIRDRRHGDLFCCISCKRLLPLDTAQVGHYISRRYEAVRWDLRNINLQCASCNKWQSGNLVEYRKSLVAIHGEKEVSRIETFYRDSPGYTVFDLQLMVERYKEILLKHKRLALA